MKVTVAFGDTKVVVPCGEGNITVRQLSELAITRYLKSIQQREKPQSMLVNINVFVLARDFGILDWDDKVADVVDDRELIIARFQIDACSNINNTVTNSTTCAKDEFINHSLNISSALPSATTRRTTATASFQDQHRPNRRRSGSLVPVSTNSIESYTYDWNLPNTTSYIHSSDEKLPLSKRFSMDSSLWLVPPMSFEPSIIGSVIPMTTETVNEIERIPFKEKSSFQISYEENPVHNPCPQSLSTDSDISKKSSFVHKSKSSNGNVPSTVQVSSPSLRSISDGKSMPRSYYSSLESTAVSDRNNSSLDEGPQDNITLPYIISNTDQITNDGKLFISKSNLESSTVPRDFNTAQESDEVTKRLPDITGPSAVPRQFDSGDTKSSELPATTKSNHNHNTFKSPLLDPPPLLPERVSEPLNLRLLPIVPASVPPPQPPMRSPSTKLSSEPIKPVFQSVNITNTNINAVDTEVATSEANVTQKIEVSSIQKVLKLPKPDHTKTTFFNSEVKIVEDTENQMSNNERSADVEAKVVSTAVSIKSSTPIAPSLRNSEHLVVTLKKSPKGFGFSLTSRQNPVDLTNPVYVSKVLDNGPAILDGRMKAGDRILTINNEDVSHLLQNEIKEILINIAVDSTVIIGLFRPNSDAISSLIANSNTLTIQRTKNSVTPAIKPTCEENAIGNQPIVIEEQKSAKFTMCDCGYNHSVMASEFDMYHFVIAQKPTKVDNLSPQFGDRTTNDTLPKLLEVKAEPPAIQLHHQNKLSPTFVSIKPFTDTKYSHATLGISVRKAFSQLFINDYESFGQSIDAGTISSIKSGGKHSKSSHKLCPNCHGLVSVKNGVFVTAIISDGVANMDGRLAIGDEIVAVQGVCLVNGERFVFPNNKVPLGDFYDNQKVAQISTQFQNRISTIDSNSPSTDIGQMLDPLSLLKQLLNYAQSISNSLSLVVLRRNSDKRSVPAFVSSSKDANYRHNVTVAADVHTQISKEGSKGEIFSLIGPNLINPKNSLPVLSVKDRIELFEDVRIKENRKRFFGKDSDDLPERNASTDLICLDSEHESDNHRTIKPSSISQNDNLNLAISHQIPPTLHGKFEGDFIHNVEKNSKEFDSVIKDPLYCIVKSDDSFSPPLPSSHNSVQDGAILDNSLDAALLYFSREDDTRQSFSLKRIHLNPPLTSRMSRLTQFKQAGNSHVPVVELRKHGVFKRPQSENILSRVEEESSDSDIGDLTDFENRVKTIGRKVTLRRRAGITRKQSRKSVL